MALFMGPLNFYKLAYTSVMMTYTLCSLVETSNPTFKSEVKRQDFEYLLTWDAGSYMGASACYTVQYTRSGTFTCPIEIESDSSKRQEVQNTSFSKSKSQPSENPPHQVSESAEPSVCPSVPEGNVSVETGKYGSNPDWKTITECSNISRLFCDLTKEFTDPCKKYTIWVKQVTESGVHTSFTFFHPYLNTCLGLPEFNVSACPNCVNVTVKLSSSTLVKVYNELDYSVQVTAEGLPSRYDRNKTREERFHSVIRNLLPNTNYCITVDMSTTVNNNQCTPSSPKCIITNSKNQSEVILPSALAAVFVAVIFIIISLILYKTGFICLRKAKWPKALKIKPGLHYSVFKSDPEETHNIQVTQENEKKVGGYDDEEEDSGSDSENDGVYTIRRPGMISKSSSVLDSMEQVSVDHSSATSDTAELLPAESEDLQHEMDKNETATNQFISPSEVNSDEEPESSHHNVNLNSVILGLSDRIWDVTTALSDQEDPVDLKELCNSHGSESPHFSDIANVQTASARNISQDWQNSGGSGESESSDSETDNVGDYMKRQNPQRHALLFRNTLS